MSIPVPNTPSMADHTDVLLYLLGVSFILIAIFVGSTFKDLKKTLTKIDNRQEKTESKIEVIDKRLTIIETKHEMIHQTEVVN